MHEGWTDFYFLVGTSAAGLIGLLFVVVTLLAGVQTETTERGQNLFMTPVVFSFAAVMTVSAFCTTERIGAQALSLIVIAVAVIGLLYMAPRVLALWKPGVAQHWSDGWYYGVLPLIGYLALSICGYGIGRETPWSETALPCVLLAFLLLGIRNGGTCSLTSRRAPAS